MQDFDAIVRRQRRSPESEATYQPRHAHPDSENKGKSAKKPTVWGRVSEVLLILVLAVILSSLLRVFLVQAFWIPSSSMEDTLQIGDNVLVSRLTPGVFELERGDVVVFRDANEWLPPVAEPGGVSGAIEKALVYTGLRPASGDQHLVKRVIGMGGDTVECCDDGGRLLVNGQAISEPYLKSGSDNSVQPFRVTVPQGHLWVMGDNRNNSADSRAHMTIPDLAFVDVNDVVGKVFWVSWPLGHWSNPTDNSPFENVR